MSSGTNGKGSKDRIRNLKKFRENYDAIFGKKKKKEDKE